MEADKLEVFQFGSLFCDQYGDPYASFTWGNQLNVVAIKSRKFRGYLRDRAYEDAGEVLTERAIDTLVDHFSALAYLNKEQRTLQLRVARDTSGDILIDGISKVYRVNETGWSIVDPPIIFRQTPAMKELCEPISGGELRKILKFVHIKDPDDQLLLLTFLVSSFVPDIAHAVLALNGPQGSGKSTLMKMLIRLIDPCSSEDVHFTDERDFLISVANRWIVPLDNLSKLKDSISDLICKFVTESSFSRRRLYTDDDEYIRMFRRVVIMNGINSTMRKADVLDRSIIMGLERIDSVSRQDEATIWKEFNDLKPELLGACFDVLSKAMSILPTIKLEEKPRLADFAIWACAISQALGCTNEDFIRAYGKNIDRQTEEALDSSPLASCLLCYFREDRKPIVNEKLVGTPTGVLRIIRAVASEAGVDDRYLPKSAKGLSNSLREIQANLESRGFVIERTRGKERSIAIYPPKKTTVTSLASQPSIQVQQLGAEQSNG